MQSFLLLGTALLGLLMGCAAGLLPGLHIYNVAGLALLLRLRGVLALDGPAFAFLLLGLLMGWLMCSLIPNVLLFAPDDGFAHAVLPSTKLVLAGRARDALLWMSLGELCAIAMLALLAPILDGLIRPVYAIIQPHMHWMLLAITAYLVLGEWPRANENQPPLRRLFSAWAYLGAGVLAFALSGILGLVLITRSPIPPELAFQNLMPAFVGLFTLPGLLQAWVYGARLPAQDREPIRPTPTTLLRASATGLAGGGFAAVLPVISGGIGGLLAGHATAQRGEQAFLIGQGATRTAYFCGGLLLLFVPGVSLVRGGMAWMLSTVFVPFGWQHMLLAVCAMCLCALLSFMVLAALLPISIRVIRALGPRVVSLSSMALALACVTAFTGLAGLWVAAVAATIGLIPAFVGGRRLNCLGVLLLPAVLGAAGQLPLAVRVLGLD